jgi:hypothetical protein
VSKSNILIYISIFLAGIFACTIFIGNQHNEAHSKNFDDLALKYTNEYAFTSAFLKDFKAENHDVLKRALEEHRSELKETVDILIANEKIASDYKKMMEVSVKLAESNIE